jgi:hypothetical protein
MDNSPEMLARVPDGALRVLSDIEDLRLGKTFDTVLLASCLINHPARRTRTSLATTAREHIASDGQLLIERHDPIWLESAEVGLASTGKGVEIFVESVRRSDPAIEMTLRFEILDRAWHQSFCVVPLHDSEMEDLLSEAGFKSFEWFGPKRRWVRAVAA